VDQPGLAVQGDLADLQHLVDQLALEAQMTRLLLSVLEVPLALGARGYLG